MVAVLPLSIWTCAVYVPTLYVSVVGVVIETIFALAESVNDEPLTTVVPFDKFSVNFCTSVAVNAFDVALKAYVPVGNVLFAK